MSAAVRIERMDELSALSRNLGVQTQTALPPHHYLHRLQLLLCHLDRMRGLVLLTVRAFAPFYIYIYLYIYL